MSELQGALQFSTVMPWFARADELARADIIDLAAVTQCDSAGAALLLELQRRARIKGRTVRFVNAPAQLRELVAFFGVDSVLNLAA
ncbi:MAG TPA: STAS domain-containing protein [Solimonas sp.]